MCKFGSFLLHPVERSYLSLPVRIPARGPVCHEVQWISVSDQEAEHFEPNSSCALCVWYHFHPPTLKWKISGSPDNSVRHVLALRTEETACRYGGQLRISWKGCPDTPDLLLHLRGGSAGRKTPQRLRFDVRNFHKDADEDVWRLEYDAV